jgi:hypothetical protein
MASATNSFAATPLAQSAPNCRHKRIQGTLSVFHLAADPESGERQDGWRVRSILICCEGRKSEPNYLKAVRGHLRMPREAVSILGLGCDPSHLVHETYRQVERRPYDKVYCVFDRDAHAHFDASLARIRHASHRIGRSKPTAVRAFGSVPSFELWLLLHFLDVRRHLERDEALSALKEHISDYEKGSTNTFAATWERLDIASVRASKLAFPGNPSTQIGDLVALLREIAANHG